MPVYQVNIQKCDSNPFPTHCNDFTTLLVQYPDDLCNVFGFTQCFDANDLVPYINPSFTDINGNNFLNVGYCLQDLGCIRFVNCQITNIPENSTSVHVILPLNFSINSCTRFQLVIRNCVNNQDTTLVLSPFSLGNNLVPNAIVCWRRRSCSTGDAIPITTCCFRLISISEVPLTTPITDCSNFAFTDNSVFIATNPCPECSSPPQEYWYYQVCFQVCGGNESFCSSFRVLCFVFQVPANTPLCNIFNTLFGNNCFHGSYFLPYLNNALPNPLYGTIQNCFNNNCISLQDCNRVIGTPPTIHFIINNASALPNPNPSIELCRVNTIQVTAVNCLDNTDIVVVIVQSNNISIGQVVQVQNIETGLINLCCYRVTDIVPGNEPATHTIINTFETCNDCIRDRYYEKEPYIKPKAITSYYPDLDTHCDPDKIQDVSCSYSSLLDIKNKALSYGLGIVKNTRSYLKNLVYFARFEVIRLKEEALNICCLFLPCCPPCITNAQEIIPPVNCNNLTINGVIGGERCLPLVINELQIYRCSPISINQFIRPACYSLTIDSFTINT